MRVTLNGTDQELADDATVSDAIAALGRDPAGKGMAVAIDGEVVARSEWSSRRIRTEDKLEVLDAIGGG